MEKIEKAIEIMMEDNGYYWCEVCEEWRGKDDRSYHEGTYHPNS